MDEVTYVDVPEVTEAARAVTATAARMHRLATGIEQWADQGRGAFPESQMCRSGLPSSAHSWQNSLDKLADEVKKYAGELQQAAKDYQDSDADAARRLRESGHPAFAPGGPN
jgi:hypothetical protein